MGIKDINFNQLVREGVLAYEKSSSLHYCRCCGNVTNPTYKLVFEEDKDKDISDEQPYLFICEDCYHDAIKH